MVHKKTKTLKDYGLQRKKTPIIGALKLCAAPYRVKIQIFENILVIIWKRTGYGIRFQQNINNKSIGPHKLEI
jgi:hypothetical protein